MEKKTYEEPTVTKVEFDAVDRVTASGCYFAPAMSFMGTPQCSEM